MKLAAPFTLNPKFTDLPDEYILRYKDTAEPQTLLDFIDIYPEKEITVIFEDMAVDIDLIKQALEKNSLIKVCLYKYQMDQIPSLQEEKIKFYFSQ